MKHWCYSFFPFRSVFYFVCSFRWLFSNVTKNVFYISIYICIMFGLSNRKNILIISFSFVHCLFTCICVCWFLWISIHGLCCCLFRFQHITTTTQSNLSVFFLFLAHNFIYPSYFYMLSFLFSLSPLFSHIFFWTFFLHSFQLTNFFFTQFFCVAMRCMNANGIYFGKFIL